MKYKVIKDFGSAKKGDILDDEEYRELGLVSFYIEEDSITRTMSMDYDTADFLCEEGKLEVIEDEDNVTKTVDLINDLLDKYKEDYDTIIESFNKGKVQPCVKVEAETVFYNLTKVLNKIKETLTDEQVG